MTHDAASPSPTPRADRRGRIGRLGEDLAVEFVTARGWSVLARNWRTRYGELDLIAADGAVLVFVEVKTRASRVFGDPAEAVTPEKLSRMHRLARSWLAEQEHEYTQIRFDVIGVRLDPRDPLDVAMADVRHHPGVFL